MREDWTNYESKEDARNYDLGYERGLLPGRMREMRERHLNLQGWTSRFQEAALDPSQWMSVLGEVAEATRSSRAELCGFGASGSSFHWVTSCEQKMQDDFHRASGGDPSVNFRLAADDGTSILGVTDERHYDRVRPAIRRFDYFDWCEQYQTAFGCQTVLVREEGALVGMSLLRSYRDGRTDENAHKIFARAACGAQTAVRMQRAIEDQGAHLLAGALEAMSLPCLLLDAVGQVRAVTRSGEELIRRNSSLTLARGRLCAQAACVSRMLELALRSVLGPERSPHVRIPIIDDQGTQLVLDLFRLPVREWSMHFAPSAMIIIREPHRLADGRGEILAATFGLTPAEIQIACALCEGTPRHRIAAERKVSFQTLRTQIRAIYSKTGCNRLAELILLLKPILD